MADAASDQAIQHLAMLARLYVEALLVDDNMADQVWELWAARIITDDVAAWAWSIKGPVQKLSKILNL